jgi:hypothetical protein
MMILLQPGVEGSCLHRLKNCLVRQWTCGTKRSAYRVGFSEKEKATARAVQWIPETGESLQVKAGALYGHFNSGLG